MELELSEDQELFLDTTRRLLAAEVRIPAVRALETTPPASTRSTGRRGAELGWTSMLVPEADGGGSFSEHGLLDLVLVAEEMGKLIAPRAARARERRRRRRWPPPARPSRRPRCCPAC